MTRNRLLLVAATLAVAATGAWAPAAQAAAYRFWTYWQATPAGWTFASAGPAAFVPADGAVEGWRFAVSTTAGTATAAPRSPASFDDICAHSPAQSGKKRVALVLDFGDPAQAPAGQVPPAASTHCVLADPDATGYQVLREVAAVRAEASGLICGIDGYPADECAPVVDDAATDPALTATPATTTAEDSDSAAPAPDPEPAGTPWLLVPVALVVAAVVAVFAWRRRA